MVWMQLKLRKSLSINIFNLPVLTSSCHFYRKCCQTNRLLPFDAVFGEFVWNFKNVELNITLTINLFFWQQLFKALHAFRNFSVFFCSSVPNIMIYTLIINKPAWINLSVPYMYAIADYYVHFCLLFRNNHRYNKTVTIAENYR